MNSVKDYRKHLDGLRLVRFGVLLLVAAVSVSHAQDVPALPSGLQQEQPSTQPAEPSGPALPSGLEGAPSEPSGPALPSGLGEQTTQPSQPAETDEAKDILDWLDVGGFLELRLGTRTQKDPNEKQMSIAEMRLQLDLEKVHDGVTYNLVTDFVADALTDSHAPRLNEGSGFIDLREANVMFSPTDFMDVKVGRQTLTWGTGNLLFLNDLFPKDWVSFFIGRDVEYLKAPSDAIKTSFYTKPVNLDIVYTPQFDADRFISGRRLSYWNSTLDRRAGDDNVIEEDRPDDCFSDDEIAARLWRTIGGYEFALYGYSGYWKSPGGQDPLTNRATFPELNAVGASVRGTIAEGIGNAEISYYDSADDPDGDDPFIDNSELRILLGYEQDVPQIAREFTVGVQYYAEIMQDYGAYKRNLPAGVDQRDEVRHLLTLDLTKQLMQQNLTLSLFAFYSPSDSDVYMRPRVSYKIDDHWTVSAGGNVFFGAHEHTFFSQFHDNSNVYAALRYGF